MKAEFFKTLWGHTGPVRNAARAAAEAGFSGLEGPFTPDLPDALAEFQLTYIAEISTTGYAVPGPRFVRE